MEAVNNRTRSKWYEIGARIAQGEPATRLLNEDPELTVEELREAVETYLASVPATVGPTVNNTS